MHPCQISMYEYSCFRRSGTIDGSYGVKSLHFEFYCPVINQTFGIMMLEDEKMDSIRQDIIKREMTALCERKCKYLLNNKIKVKF